ncbi:MAG: cytidine/deoxycytidylate deaminase family protein [Candidatus Pacebacteria bacterium]|nr:cytidine/deoxycytidylate deaminase family protein [Candidatus Paceibacterota bacterium]
MKKRPSWDEYFMKMAFLIKDRSTCLRRSVGAISVKDKKILTTGYNGAPSGMEHCLDIGCKRQELNIPSGERAELCRGVHAEQNCIIQAAFHGVSLKGATLYITNQPCSICAKMVINAGFKRIVYCDPYDDKLSLEILEKSKIKIEIFN